VVSVRRLCIGGFIRQDTGIITDFIDPSASTLPNEGTLPLSVNGNGEITGYYTDTSNFGHGFLLNRQH
jgi:hypothetical protein